MKIGWLTWLDSEKKERGVSQRGGDSQRVKVKEEKKERGVSCGGFTCGEVNTEVNGGLSQRCTEKR